MFGCFTQSQEKHLYRVDILVQTSPRSMPEPAPGFLWSKRCIFSYTHENVLKSVPHSPACWTKKMTEMLEILTQETNAPFTNVYIKFARNYSDQPFSDKQTKTI